MTMQLDRKQWLAGRQNGIGGSDAAAAVGVSPWKSRYQLWLEKTSDEPHDSEPTEAMLWGTRMEPLIRERYCELTGREVLVPSKSIKHADHDWMLASLDGVTDDDRIFEAKTSRIAEGWGDSGSDEIPEHYSLQVQHYMAVTGADLADVAVLIGSSDFRILTVPADPELQTLLIEREREFWSLVESKTPPEPTTPEDIKLRFPISRGDYAEGDQVIHLAWQQLRALKDEMTILKAQQESLESRIKQAIGDRDGVKFDGEVLATWKSAKPTIRFDAKAFKQRHPKVYAAFERPAESSRRFLLKSPKIKKGGK